MSSSQGRPGLTVEGTSAASAGRRAFGRFLRELRKELGWSQGQLAAKLAAASGRPTITRELVSRWEHGTRLPCPFWMGHLAAVLQVPRYVLEDLVRRRDMMMLTGVAAAAALTGIAARARCADLFASIAAGDDGPLTLVQTSHETDLLLASMAVADKPVLRLTPAPTSYPTEFHIPRTSPCHGYPCGYYPASSSMVIVTGKDGLVTERDTGRLPVHLPAGP